MVLILNWSGNWISIDFPQSAFNFVSWSNPNEIEKKRINQNSKPVGFLSNQDYEQNKTKKHVDIQLK